MKVPTVPVKVQLAAGTCVTSNSAAFSVEPEYPTTVLVRLGTKHEPDKGYAYFNVQGAREAASFFNNLANVLEGKEQQ